MIGYVKLLKQKLVDYTSANKKICTQNIRNDFEINFSSFVVGLKLLQY